MNKINSIGCVLSILFIITTVSSYSKTPKYTWEKGNIEISTEGVLENPAMNSAQNKILVKNAARKAGYQAITRIIFTLPLDSTRRVGDLEKSNPDFSEKLPTWIVLHSALRNFQYTSESTGSVKINLDARELARFVSRYDKPVVNKTRVENKKAAKAATEAAVKNEKDKKNPKEETSKPKKAIEVEAQLTLSTNTSTPIKVQMSDAEASIRAMAKEDLYHQLNTTPVSGTTTYLQWVHIHPAEEPGLMKVIDDHTVMSIPQWAKENTLVKLNARLELKYLLEAVKEFESAHKAENKNAVPKKTNANPPAPSN